MPLRPLKFDPGYRPEGSRLTYVSEAVRIHPKRRRILAACDCGGETHLTPSQFANATIRSCGCLISEVTADRNRTHGESWTPLWCRWSEMRKRTTPGTTAYEKRPAYASGKVDRDPRWDDYETFRDDVGDEFFDGAHLDRIDNERGYWPDNVQWLTPSEHGFKTVNETWVGGIDRERAALLGGKGQ